jgi:hypothetical protein
MPKSKKPKPSFSVARADIGAEPAGWVYRSNAKASADASSAPPIDAEFVSTPHASAAHAASDEASAGWIEVSVSVMVLPLTAAIVVMLAPVIWMFAPKARQ